MKNTYLSYRDSTYWVLNIGCTSHICNDSQKKKKKVEVELKIRNDTRVFAFELRFVNLKVLFAQFFLKKNYLESFLFRRMLLYS